MSVYTGSNNGFMQAAYVDQQGTALPGDLAYASDVDLIDACVVSKGTCFPSALAWWARTARTLPGPA